MKKSFRIIAILLSLLFTGEICRSKAEDPAITIDSKTTREAFTQKIAQATKQIAEQGATAENLLRRARLLLTAGATRGAMEDVMQVIKSEPENYAATAIAVRLLLADHRDQKTFSRLSRALIEQEPNNPTGHWLASLWDFHGYPRHRLIPANYRREIESIDNAIRFGRDGSVEFVCKGMYLAGDGSHEQAVKAFQKAHSLDELNFHALAGMAYSEHELSRSEKAVRSAETAIGILEQTPRDTLLRKRYISRYDLFVFSDWLTDDADEYLARLHGFIAKQEAYIGKAGHDHRMAAALYGSMKGYQHESIELKAENKDALIRRAQRLLQLVAGEEKSNPLSLGDLAVKESRRLVALAAVDIAAACPDGNVDAETRRLILVADRSVDQRQWYFDSLEADRKARDAQPAGLSVEARNAIEADNRAFEWMLYRKRHGL